MEPVVFQRMDSRFHPVLVETEGHGANKRGRSETAGAAQAGEACRRVEGVATASAGRAGLKRKLRPAGSADWHKG
jgi:hypothetical protein